ncbi:MAG: hypothetical protein L0I76_38180, partial [Pseudonocardia sp.]|nr:hypothetical protein [Pseudonocardia sp.]
MVAVRRRDVDPEKGAVERALARLDHAIIYRWPHIAGPLALAGTAFGLGWGAHRWPGILQWTLTVLVGVVVFLGAESINHLPGRRERGYAWACWLGGGGW